MKKTIITLLGLVLFGAGCVANKNILLAPTPTSDVNRTLSTPLSENLDNIKPDLFVLHDNLGTIPAHLRTNLIVEISEPKNITFSAADKNNSEGAVRYYRAGDVYFVITQHPGSMSLAEYSTSSASTTGIWYGGTLTKNTWKQYLTLNNSKTIANNIFHFWKNGNATNILAIDSFGGGSGEGIAKILTSEDGGVNWFASNCFYVSPENLPEIFHGEKVRLNLSKHLKQKIANHQIQNYVYNAKTGNYESSQRNKTTGVTETITQESCKNISVPSKALTAETFSPSMIADNPKQIDLPVLINETEPVYTISVITATTNTPAKITYRRGDDTTQHTIALPITIWGLPERAEIAGSFFVLRDVNFDGYTDIGLTVDGGAKWSNEQYWLFDAKTKKFISNQLTSDLRNIVHYEIKFDTSTERIITNNFIGPGILRKTIYGIKNGRVIELQNFEKEPGYTADSEPTGTCTTITTRLVNGKQQTTREHSDSECTGYNPL